MATSINQVMQEIRSGNGLSLSTVARTFPGHRGQSSINPSTVLRWIQKGVRSPQGEWIRLEAIRMGSRWLTTHECVRRFSEALTPSVPEAFQVASPVRSPSERQRASDAAGRKLEDMGA